jgi:hypothetical protein
LAGAGTAVVVLEAAIAACDTQKDPLKIRTADNVQSEGMRIASPGGQAGLE